MHPIFSSSGPNVRRAITAAGVGGIALITLTLASCGPTGQQRYERKLADTGKPAMHGVQSERIKEIMHKLTFDPLSESETGVAEEQRRADQLTEVATAMAATAPAITAAAKDLELSDRDREVFLKLADKFRDQANAVRQAAKEKNFNEAKRSIERMQATCNACHTLFRP